jgi:hypothetical protein
MADGRLGQDLDARLAHFTYTEVDSDGPDRHYQFTVVLVSVPESIGFIPRLSCVRRGLGLNGSLTDLDDDTTRDDRGVELESEALRKRFKLRVDADVGDNWVRQLFAPAFITWLADEAPDDFAFELYDGALCAYMRGATFDYQRLDALWTAAAEVGSRVRAEALEEEGLAEAGRAALPDRPHESRDAMIERAVKEVEWKEPPPDAAMAIRAYRWVAMRAWKPWLSGAATLFAGLLIGGALLAADDSHGAGVLLVSPVAAGSIFGKLVGDRRKAFGKAAFARGYAASRGLRLENPRMAQARHMRLALPGVAEFAMSGTLPGSGRSGTVLFMGTRTGATRSEYNGVVLPIAAETKLDDAVLGEGLQVARHGGTAVLYAKSAGDTKRSAEEVDRFLGRALAAVGGSS